MSYDPKPIDTTLHPLPTELVALREHLAEHVHDVWAAGRLKEGWVYGPNRDDAARTHPCLVPYSELPDAEKEYDRQTAEQTLHAILSLGFVVTPPTR